MQNKTCFIIVGPTAVGKTAVALRLAQELRTEIISADSRQCYRELNIGVAKPSTEELQIVNHYFINSHCIHEEVNAALFEQYALNAAETIFSQSNTAIMVGGTGLYVDAFCHGLDEMPVILPEVRAEVQRGFQQSGLAWLQSEVKHIDPDFFSVGEVLNPHRLMRALEVKRSTGRSIRTFHTKQKKQRPFKIIRIGLELARDELYANINRRVDLMISCGLLNEANELLPFRNLNALNTVGYRELFDYEDGKFSLEEAVRLVKLNTRHYAKRQLTWFKRDTSTIWFHPAHFDRIYEYCSNQIMPDQNQLFST